MGRAQGIANAAGRYPRRQRTVGRYLSVNEMQMVRAAIRGDFEPFLRAAQTPTPASDAMLDSEVVVTICRLAMDNARADHARTLDRRLVAGGVGTQTLRAGIVQAVSHQAEHDLRSSLYRLVEEQAAGKARVATPDDLAKQARALLDNRISEALGEPVDRELAAGVWQALRGAN